MIHKERIKSILSDIRFWIILFFILRLIGITNAPLEIGHNWRQVLTNMIARNFLEGNANIMYPQVDMAGNQSGIIGSEFPFFNYLICLVSYVFNYGHWYGRLINLIVSSFGIYYFFLLIRKICNKNVAFNASIVLLSSIWFGFSRKSMPDTFSVALVIIGLYYCYDFAMTGSLTKILLFFLFATLGMLCKIPALSLVSLVLIIIIAKEITAKRKLIVLIVSALSIGVVCLWYFYWVPYLVATYHFQLYFPKGIVEGFREILPLWPDFLEKFYFSSLYSYTALAFLFAGLFFIYKGKNFYLKTEIIIVTLVFFIFILKTGAVFPTHSYYIISFTPVMAFLSGYGLSKFPAKYLYIALIIIAVEGIASQQHDFFIKDSERYKLSLEDLTNKNIGKNDLIVINGGQSPQEIYFAHRKGWSVGNADINKKELNSLMNLGAHYLIIDKKSFNTRIEYYPKIYSDKNFIIYHLK
jgi:hypothetical protein